MLGAVIGDIVGSRFEFSPIKTKEFALFSSGCRFTDDTVMTMAAAQALLLTGRDPQAFQTALVAEMRRLGRAYPNAGYGGRFAAWLTSPDPAPYGSFGNGSAMRVSPCGFAARSLEEALALAEASAVVTHNHPQAIKGAQAVAACIYLAKTGADKETIRAYVRSHFYPLHQTLEHIRPDYRFDVSCQGSVPQSIQAFLEGSNLEDTVRNAVSLGGDSDTMACIGGAIAQAFYGVPQALACMARTYLPQEFLDCIDSFQSAFLAEE